MPTWNPNQLIFNSDILSYLQRFLKLYNTSHTLFLLTKGSTILSRHILRYLSKRVQDFLSNCPAGGKNTFTKAQKTCQAQQRTQIHLPRELKFSTPQNRPTFLVTLTGYGTRGREKASGSCIDTDQRYFIWLKGVSLFSHKYANLLICRDLYNNSC